MRIIKCAVLAAITLLSFACHADAGHILDTGSGYQNGPLYITVLGHNGDNSFQTSGGSIGLDPNFGSIDGVTIPYLYCVEIFTQINVPGSYHVDISNAGIVHGALVPNAGQIAWLLDNVAPTATSQDQQEGLQAAIWQQVFGPSFSVDSVNTGAGIYSNYLADLAALGGNSAPLNHVLWLSPYNGDESPAQGLITTPPQVVPEPSSFVLLGLGFCSFAALRLRKRFA